MDYLTKLFKYRTAGVREYWVVDPDKNLILVYNFEQGTSEQYTLSDKVKAGIYRIGCEIHRSYHILKNGHRRNDMRCPFLLS